MGGRLEEERLGLGETGRVGEGGDAQEWRAAGSNRKRRGEREDVAPWKPGEEGALGLH